MFFYRHAMLIIFIITSSLFASERKHLKEDTMQIAQLTHEHLSQYKALRLQGLLEFPEAFGALYEEEVDQPDSFWESRLTNNRIFGTFNNETLVGIVHFSQVSQAKTKHRGFVRGMYVDKAWQNKKVGSKLLKHVIEYAKPLVTQLHLTCISTGTPAITFYVKHGFRMYATDPDSFFYRDYYYNSNLLMYEYENEKELV